MAAAVLWAFGLAVRDGLDGRAPASAPASVGARQEPRTFEGPLTSEGPRTSEGPAEPPSAAEGEASRNSRSARPRARGGASSPRPSPPLLPEVLVPPDQQALVRRLVRDLEQAPIPLGAPGSAEGPLHAIELEPLRVGPMAIELGTVRPLDLAPGQLDPIALSPNEVEPLRVDSNWEVES